MQRCLELAALGCGGVAPNPMVGCIIVHREKIIGEGYHQKFGGAHAEVNAIRSVSDPSLLPESTIYVSLEPCAHFGKTPPCADLIIENRMKRAVLACLDPFAKVNGAGIKRLMDAGVDLRIGVCEQEALELNKRFVTFHEKKRPYIILKWAETADGFVDNLRTDSGQRPLKITCDESDILHHKWRTEEAAILIGKNTALLDNPSLTARLYSGNNPTRIILDPKGDLPPSLNVFSESSKTLVFSEKSQQAHSSGTEWIQTNDIRDLNQLMRMLHVRNIQSIIVEGGPTLQRSFIAAGLWDEMRRFVAPFKIGSGVDALKPETEAEQQLSIGDDRLYIYRHR